MWLPDTHMVKKKCRQYIVKVILSSKYINKCHLMMTPCTAKAHSETSDQQIFVCKTYCKIFWCRLWLQSGWKNVWLWAAG